MEGGGAEREEWRCTGRALGSWASGGGRGWSAAGSWEGGDVGQLGAEVPGHGADAAGEGVGAARPAGEDAAGAGELAPGREAVGVPGGRGPGRLDLDALVCRLVNS